jgi:amino acid adenylation domain-containing protein
VSVLLQDYATRSAAVNPSKVALVMEDERMTYGELQAQSNQLARLLKKHGCRPGDRVCLLAEKSPSAIMAMHAILKAGAAYVPVDLSSPAIRIGKMLDVTEPRLVLVTAAAAGALSELRRAGRLTMALGSLESPPVIADDVVSAFGPSDWLALPADALEQGSDPSSSAHILFTSGSTGAPKGVVVTHASVSAFLDWAIPYFGLRSSDRHSNHPPLHFDLSTFDIYGTLAAGAELHLVPPRLSVDPRRLASLIRDSKLTQWFSVPSVLTYMTKFDAVAQDDFPDLKRLLWCGEVLPTPVLRHWMTRLPHVRFTNLYGPTEATIASSYYTVAERPADSSQAIPIGTACTGEELLVLDDERRPVRQGDIGEIFIAGAGLSPGYWRDQEKTDMAFLPDPRPGCGRSRLYRTGDLGRIRDDGLLEFLGRADSQVKSRGYRIELGEIEAALSEIVELRESAVVGVAASDFEGTTICCAYVPQSEAAISPADLRRNLSKVLPAYMLPSRWSEFENLPKNINGKIDRRAISERFQEELQTRPAITGSV